MDAVECKMRHIQGMHSARKMEKLCRYKPAKKSQGAKNINLVLKKGITKLGARIGIFSATLDIVSRF